MKSAVYDNGIEQPFEDEDREDLTIGDLKKLNLPDDYKLKFDGFCGSAWKADTLIDHDSKEISING